MKLYTFFRSSASYRVRIALNLKGLEYEQIPIHLRRGGGEQLRPEYMALNPHGLVPTLEDEGRRLTQSLAIIEYLEERFPEPPLLPRNPVDRATVRSLALAVACEIHPIQNLRVLRHLRSEYKLGEDDVNRWARHWIELGFTALEKQILAFSKRGQFCFGDTVSLADVCLVPQLANARRFGCALNAYPTLTGIEARCIALPAFAKAAPDAQPDAE